ncbi:unnamed protein product [Didymodactylos carnosus]|uniref:Integrase catalytic domain-containing protein n=1 Tax=Didymodactylos carnosus TaxID=1234261 RepID=A0A815EVA3_9BILA|nr:unnamed protein product [Didymodactylos carnosus]CAF1342700.1 unnamed protein product [Didymodactylos carnosus]CAF4153709.1 unnamed protein product [Didymodactylos carnosus]CAF4165762.1 unnamed protein product [Didymodactylos carnosus]
MEFTQLGSPSSPRSRMHQQYVLINDIVHKVVRSQDKTTLHLAYLPKSLISTAIKNYQNHLTAPHFGISRTWIRLFKPLSTSVNGNKYVLILTDHLTKYVETNAISQPPAQDATKFVVEQVILRHGTSTCILTDRGTHFTAELFQILHSAAELEPAVLLYGRKPTCLFQQCYGSITIPKTLDYAVQADRYLKQARQDAQTNNIICTTTTIS